MYTHTPTSLSGAYRWAGVGGLVDGRVCVYVCYGGVSGGKTSTGLGAIRVGIDKGSPSTRAPLLYVQYVGRGPRRDREPREMFSISCSSRLPFLWNRHSSVRWTTPSHFHIIAEPSYSRTRASKWWLGDGDGRTLDFVESPEPRIADNA